MNSKTLKYFCIYLLSLIVFQSLALKGRDWAFPSKLDFLNSSSNDFAPIYNPYLNSIYFASDKSGKSLIYEISYDDFIDKKEAKVLKADFNTNTSNQAYICFESANLAYYTAFDMKERRSYQNIFYSKSRKQEWTKGFLMNDIAWNAYTGQATVSADGRYFVFVSDKNSEYKDTDLWIRYKQNDGNYGEATKLEILNSPGNEITPHFLGSDTLYFASDGQKGPGGYDIYYSIKINGEWQRPQAFEEINTEDDESDIAFLNSKHCIFASNRASNSKLDLYEMKKNEIDSVPTVVNIDKVELSIFTFVSSVRVINSYDYRLSPFQSILTHAELASNTQFDYRNDSLSLSSIQTLSERLNENKSLKLVVNSVITDDQDSNKAEQRFAEFSEYLFEQSKINLDRLTHKILIRRNGKSNYAFLSSDNCKLIAPIEIKQAKFTSEPSIFGLDINARPADEISSWKLDLIMQADTIEISKGNELPYKAVIPLSDLASQLILNDFFELRLTAISKSNEHLEYLDTIQIVRNVSSHQLQEFDNGKPILVYYYNLQSELDAGISNCQNALLDDFLAGFSPSQVTIEFNSDNNLSEAEFIMNQMKSKFPKAKIISNPNFTLFEPNMFKLKFR